MQYTSESFTVTLRNSQRMKPCVEATHILNRHVTPSQHSTELLHASDRRPVMLQRSLPQCQTRNLFFNPFHQCRATVIVPHSPCTVLDFSHIDRPPFIQGRVDLLLDASVYNVKPFLQAVRIRAVDDDASLPFRLPDLYLRIDIV